MILRNGFIMLCIVGFMVAGGSAAAAGVVGNGTPESCTADAFMNALAANSEISFSCGPNPHVITIPVQQVISSNKSIDGGGLIAIHAGIPVFANDRHFLVKEGAQLTLMNITLRYGSPKNGGYGGCVHVEHDARFILRNSKIRDCFVLDDFAGGLIHNEGLVDITDSELSHGKAGSGGAINSSSVLHLIGSTVHDNKAVARVGGAIALGGTSEIHGSSFSANQAHRAGGAIFLVYTGEMQITYSNFIDNQTRFFDANLSNNSEFDMPSYRYRVETRTPSTAVAEIWGGGGLANQGRISRIENVLFSNNKSHDVGGGIYNNGHMSTLKHVQFIGNSAWTHGGGLYNFYDLANLEIANSVFDGNIAEEGTGGGFWLERSGEVVDSLFTHNRADYGSAISHGEGTLEILNSTFSNNVSKLGGALGAFRDSSLEISSSTLYQNEAKSGDGHAFFLFAGSGNKVAVFLDSTIVANSQFQANSSLCAVEGPGGKITSTGFNIDSDDSCNLTKGSDQPNTDPILLPLADNGGPTWSHMPAPGSPAIDRGRTICTETDQRGYPRPVGSACDIGAIEVGGYAQKNYLPMVTK